jgi:hypothetical protein
MALGVRDFSSSQFIFQEELQQLNRYVHLTFIALFYFLCKPTNLQIISLQFFAAAG